MRDDALKGLLSGCARCGTCRTVCTLYPERGTELNVARGKIALLDAVLRPRGGGEGPEAAAGEPAGGGGRPGRVREALLDCLLCGRCERNCPNGVQVEEILVKGRALVAESAGLPAWKRALFGRVLASPSGRGMAVAAGGVLQRLFMEKVPAGSGLHYRFPGGGGLHGRTVPALPSRGFVASLSPDEAREGGAMLFPGCVFDLVLPDIGRAAYETVSAAAGPVFVSRDASCCGLPAMAAGDRASALESARRNVTAMRAARPEAIVFPCGSCLAMFRRSLLFLLPQDDPLRPDAEWVARRCVDYASFILGTGLPARLGGRTLPAPGGSVGWHDPCHLSGTLGKGAVSRELLARVAGSAFREMPGADRCCGHGGTFNVRDYPTSARLGENKVAPAVRGGTGTIVTACSGCILQLRDGAARLASSVRVRHIAECVSALLPR